MTSRITTKQFYRILGDFARHYPKKDLRCQRLNTFAIVSSLSMVNTTNLGKTMVDRDKPYFWSRSWAKSNYSPSKIAFDYPAMLGIEVHESLYMPFKAASSNCVRLQIAVVDKLDRGCLEKGANCKGCSARTINDIYIGMRKFVKEFLDYLCGVEYYEHSTDPDLNVWLHHSVAAEVLDSAWQPDIKASRQFAKSLGDNNDFIKITNWHGGVDDVYGCYFYLDLCFKDCDKTKFKPNVTDYKFGADQGCC